MLSGMFQNSCLPVLEEATYFTQARHNVLAGNVANHGVPGYVVRDLSVDAFQQELRQAIEARDTQQETWSPGMASSPEAPNMRNVRKSLESVLFHDGTNVGMEQQVAEINKNQSLHNMAISVMVSQFRLLQAAVSERV